MSLSSAQLSQSSGPETVPQDQNRQTEVILAPKQTVARKGHGSQNNITTFHETLGSGGGNGTLSSTFLSDAEMALTIVAAEDHWQTFENGDPCREKDRIARTIDVGIHYIGAGDLADIIKDENTETFKNSPIIRPPLWKTNTAGAMLKDPKVLKDLSIEQTDKTATILAKHEENVRRGKSWPTSMKDLWKTAPDNRVNIHSKHVHILRTLPKAGEVGVEHYELFCTCIEVDGQGLLKLIFNFRSLIAGKGQYAFYTVAETKAILETMVEDARRLLTRSPILSRLKPRLAIQKSQNTRYGVDNGTRFFTFTTSAGIAEMILTAVSYYSTLQTSSPSAQQEIRPKLLQMVVLLLSLLNDQDLKDIGPMLEKNYELQSDRKSVELTILKVLTLSTVGPMDFLGSTLSNVYRKHVNVSRDESGRAMQWDNFLGDIATHGWLLSGTPEQLKTKKQMPKKDGSWKVAWDRFDDSDIFDHLQYCGEKGTVNKIPALKTNTEKLGTLMIPAQFLNGRTYNVQAKDLELITRTEPETYDVEDQDTKQHVDVTVDSAELFAEILDAGEDLVKICRTINAYSPPIPELPQEKEKAKRGITNITGRKKESKEKEEPRIYFQVPKLHGQRDKRTTLIISGPSRTRDIIAISWILEGKKIPFNDMLFSVQNDLNLLNVLMKKLGDFQKGQLDRAIAQQDSNSKKLLESLAKQLEIVDRRLKKAGDDKTQLQTHPPEIGDEPISRIDFPDHGFHFHQPEWHPYKQKYTLGSALELESDRYIISSIPEWKEQVVYFRVGKGAAVTAVPLSPVPEKKRAKELLKGDSVLMLGNLLAIVVSKKEKEDLNSTRSTTPKVTEKIVNFLQLIKLDEDDGEDSDVDRRGDSDDEDDVHQTTILDVSRDC